MRVWNKHALHFENGVAARQAITDLNIAAHPSVPAEYWAFLREVGRGHFVGLQFYEGVMRLSEQGLTDAPTNFLAFADDMAGAYYGFLVPGDEVVVVDSHGWVPSALGQSFEAFLADCVSSASRGD